MSNQSQRDAIRAYMREHDVNYTTARRAILGNAVEVNPQTDDLSALAERGGRRWRGERLVGGRGFKPFDLGSLAASGIYDPLRFVPAPTFVNLDCEGEPSEHLLDVLRDLGATSVTPFPDGGTVAPLGFEIEFTDLPQGGLRGQVQDLLDAMVTDHEWRYAWEGGTLRVQAAPPLPPLAAFPAEGSAECEAWHERFRRGVITLGPARGGGTAAIDLDRSPHVLLGGYAGAGKTILTNLIAYGVVSNPDHVEAVLVDSKGVEYGWIPADAENLSIINGGDNEATLAQARDALEEAFEEMRRRQRLLREHKAENLAGLRKRGGSEIPRRRLVILDDAGLLFAPYKDPALAAVQDEARGFVEQIAMWGRDMEVNLVALAQRPSRENLGTGLSAQFTNRIAIGRMSRQSALSILGRDCALPEDAPKGRARFVTDDGADVEVQLYAMPVRDLVDPETEEVLVQGVRRRVRRPGRGDVAGRVLAEPIDYPSIAAYNQTHPDFPAPVGDQSWASCSIPPLVDEYADAGRIAQFVPAGDDRPDRRGNLVVVPDGASTGTVRVLAVGVTVAQVRALVLDRPRTEDDLRRALTERL